MNGKCKKSESQKKGIERKWKVMLGNEMKMK